MGNNGRVPMDSYSSDYGTYEIDLFFVISSSFWSATELAWVSFKFFLLNFFVFRHWSYLRLFSSELLIPQSSFPKLFQI